MDADSSRVVVTYGDNAKTAFVYHRDFTEIRAEGSSARDAAQHLMNKLSLALDTALTDWRRESVGKAIADVKAYVEQEASSES